MEEDQGYLNRAKAERALCSPTPVQGRNWVRAWMQARLWQDGIGVVPDRDNYQDPVRIEPSALRTARELLVWALGRIAHGAEDLLDLETFLADLWSAAAEEAISISWYQYSWKPKLKLSHDKRNIQADRLRRRAFWLDGAGALVANALLGTLAHLGLVERGYSGSAEDGPVCFRLTGLGKTVFGAPEQIAPEPHHDAKFLSIQPNHEVLVYLDSAEASEVWPLAQMAQRVSSAGGLVQTFALTRESIYQALESGLTLEQIRQFLLKHSKTGLPANVGQSLVEWGRKREALVLRTDIGLGAFPAGRGHSFQGMAKAQPIGDRFVLLPRKTAHSLKDGPVLDHHRFARPLWQVEEDGRVKVKAGADAVSLARLAQFADPDGKEWRISAVSVGRAHERGISAEQILGWLEDHLASTLPAILETAIRNWLSSARIFLGNVVMLQVPQPRACAMILASWQFHPFLLGHVPPNGFLVRPEKRAELEQLLTELGFSVGGTYQLTALSEEDTTATDGPAPKAGRRKRKGPKQ